MHKARTVRACNPPRLWHGLLTYHAIGVNVTNPVDASTMDILDVFSSFDDTRHFLPMYTGRLYLRRDGEYIPDP